MSDTFDVAAATEQLARQLAVTALQRDRGGGHAAVEREAIRRSGLLAHVYAFHNLQIASIQLWGNPAQQVDLLPRTLQEDWFWGNALNPRDSRLKACRAGVAVTSEVLELTGAGRHQRQTGPGPLLAPCATAHPARPHRPQAPRHRPFPPARASVGAPTSYS